MSSQDESTTGPLADGGELLFCPFCKEAFENETFCPDHELELTTFDKAFSQKEEIAESTELAFYDLRFGRGVLMVSAAMMLVGFFGPFLSTTANGEVRSGTGLAVAGELAMNLWLIPVVAGTFLSILIRRRSLSEMRRVRLAIVLLGLLAGGSLILTVYRIRRAALAASSTADVSVLWGGGFIVIGIATAILCMPFFGKAKSSPNAKS